MVDEIALTQIIETAAKKKEPVRYPEIEAKLAKMRAAKAEGGLTNP